MSTPKEQPAEERQAPPPPMITRLDIERVRALSDAFPGEGWQQIEAKSVILDDTKSLRSTWKSFSALRDVGGVYAMLLPSEWCKSTHTLPLHASHRYKGQKISFEFTVEPFLPDGYGVVYVGRTASLEDRWRGHLSPGQRKNGGQVKFGLMDCGLHPKAEDALRALRRHARIIYTPLPGPENCANRDLLELTLCARFAPPFNIKAER